MSAIQSERTGIKSVYRSEYSAEWREMVWVLAAAGLGLTVAAVFAGNLQLPRNLFLLPYIGLTSVFLFAYLRRSGVDWRERFRHHWGWGLLGTLLVSVYIVPSVLRSARAGPCLRPAVGGHPLRDYRWVAAFGAAGPGDLANAGEAGLDGRLA